MKHNFRCNCPITSALDLLGDKWSLVVIKQMLIEGKKTFKDFLEGEEAIATNILSSRLTLLEKFNIITKHNLLVNKKTKIYKLTGKGLALTPVLIELGIWSDAHMREFHPRIMEDENMFKLKHNKTKFIFELQKNYRHFSEISKMEHQ